MTETLSDGVWLLDEPERGVFVLSFAESINKNPGRINGKSVFILIFTLANSQPTLNYPDTIVIFTYLDGLTIILPPMKIIRRYQYFYVRQCADDQGPFAFARCGIQQLRQGESTFFRLCEPWASRSKRDNLGVANILKTWGSPESSSIKYFLTRSLGLVNETQFTVDVPSFFYTLLLIVVVFYFLHFAVYQLFM